MASSYIPSRKLILVLCVLLLTVSAILYAGSQPTVAFSSSETEPAAAFQPNPKFVAPSKDTARSLHAVAAAAPVVAAGAAAAGGGVDGGSDKSGSVEVYKDAVDNTKGFAYLKKYKSLFADTSADSGDPNVASTIKEWWQAAAMIDWYIESTPRYKCKKRAPAGNWHVCQDEPYTVKPPCLVYSFGINWDFSFDDAMGKMGCEVHSFDPSMGTGDHKRNPHVTFHNMGLGGNDSNEFDARHDMYVQKQQQWKMRTLRTAMKELGHEGRVLDVLKIDIEGHEWAVLENLFNTDMFKYVRQFELEFHLFPSWPAKEEYVHLYKLYTKLREMGFREYAVGPHPKTLKYSKFNLQGDSEYVNIYFKPPPAS